MRYVNEEIYFLTFTQHIAFKWTTTTLFMIGKTTISWSKYPTTNFKKVEYVVGCLLQLIAVFLIINKVVTNQWFSRKSFYPH